MRFWGQLQHVPLPRGAESREQPRGAAGFAHPLPLNHSTFGLSPAGKKGSSRDMGERGGSLGTPHPGVLSGGVGDRATVMPRAQVHHSSVKGLTAAVSPPCNRVPTRVSLPQVSTQGCVHPMVGS